MSASTASSMEVKSSTTGQPNLTQCYKQLATTSTSTQVTMLSWHYVTEKGTTNRLNASV